MPNPLESLVAAIVIMALLIILVVFVVSFSLSFLILRFVLKIKDLKKLIIISFLIAIIAVYIAINFPPRF